MGEFSFTHILLFVAILMLFFGSSKIEGIGKSLGRSIRGFKECMSEIDTEAKPVQDARKELNQDSAQKTQQTQTETTKEPRRS